MLIKICKICLQFPGEKENKRLSIKKSLEVYSSSFFIACEGVCAMYNGLRGLRALTDLKST